MRVGFNNGEFSSRTQGAALTAGITGKRYFDGTFFVDFHKMGWNEHKKCSLSLKVKKADNGQSDLSLEPSPTTSSLKNTNHTRTNLKFFNTKDGSATDITFNKKKYHMFVFNKMLSGDYKIAFETNASDTGNMIKFGVKSQATYNPVPDNATYLSAGFQLGDSDTETITIIQAKRPKQLKDQRTYLFKIEDVSTSNNPITKYPSLYLQSFIKNYAYGHAQDKDVYIRTMISRLYFEIKTTALETSVRKFHTLLHPISEDQQFFHEAVYLSSNTTTNEFFSYVEYYDPVFYPGYYSMMNRFYRKVTEPMESAFVNGLRYSIQTDVTFCGRDVECDASKPTILQQLRSASLIPSFMQSNIPLGKFRIKFLQGGKCMNSYQSGSNMVVIGDAKCRDVWAFGMHLYPEHPFSLWNIELGLRITGDISKQLQISDSANSPNKHHYALGVNKNTLVLPTSPYNRGARCVLYNSNNNKVELSNTELIGNAGHCTAKKNGHVKFLPDYSAHYDRLNMKSLMTTTITSGEDILLVCDPKRDLKVKSNCHYSKDNQLTWTGLPSLVTQITFYIPSDDLFYGYCNEVKYHCSWSLQSNKVLAMDDASYNGKLADVSKVVASNLDAQSLWLPNNVQIFSQDSDIGVNSLAIYKAENGWKKIYHWTN